MIALVLHGGLILLLGMCLVHPEALVGAVLVAVGAYVTHDPHPVSQFPVGAYGGADHS